MTQLSLLGRAHAEAACPDNTMATRALFEALANEIERLTRERAGAVLVSRLDAQAAARCLEERTYGAGTYDSPFIKDLFDQEAAARFRAALNQQGETK